MNIQRYKKVEFNLFKSLSMKKEKLNLWYTNGLNYRINFSNQKIKYINSVYLFYSFKPQQSKHLLIISAFLNCWENVFSPALSSSTQGPMNTCELRGLETTSFLVLHAQKEDAKWGRKYIKEWHTHTRSSKFDAVGKVPENYSRENGDSENAVS